MNIYSEVIKFNLRRIPDRTTTCFFSISIKNENIWPTLGDNNSSLEIQIDDLLSYLIEFWKQLFLVQVYPIDIMPSRPADMWREAGKRWNNKPDQIVEREESFLLSFAEAHNLASSFNGIFGLQPFWILRSNNEIICDTVDNLYLIPLQKFHSALTEVGDQICGILTDSDTERWNVVSLAWREREKGNPIDFLRLSIGVNTRIAQDLVQDHLLKAPHDFSDAVNDNDELKMAARMVGALSYEQIKAILLIARSFVHTEHPALHELSLDCQKYIQNYNDRRPHVQGELLASFVREKLSIENRDRINIFRICSELDIEIKAEKAQPPTLSGLAIWGKSYGPGAFLNLNSTRIIQSGREIKSDISNLVGARITLAHELCHLLLDGSHGFSVVEVLKNRSPINIEQRAKSFAGEILLPTKRAGDLWIEAGKPKDDQHINHLLDLLCKKFSVTRSVASWKLEHALLSFDVDISSVLEGLAPKRR